MYLPKLYTSPGLLWCEIQKPAILKKALSASLFFSVSGTGFWVLGCHLPCILLFKLQLL